MFLLSPEHVFGSLRLFAVGLFAIAMAFVLAARSEAKPTVTLEIDTSVLVSDNPFLTTEKKKTTGAAEILARPRVQWQIDPRTDVDVAGEVGFRQYSRRYGNFVTGRSNLQIRHRRNEHLTVSARASYERDLASDALTDSIDFAIDPLSIRESIDARGLVAWSPTATTTITGEGGWRRLRYPDSDLLETTKAYDFSAGLNKRLSEKLTVGVQGRHTSSRIINGDNTLVNALNLTATRRFATFWYGGAQVGIEWTKLRDPATQARNSRARFNGSANLCYEPDGTSVCLRSALQSEVSGLGGLQREFSVGTAIRHRISELGTIRSEVDYRRARLPGDRAPARVFRSSVGYDHRIGRNLYLTPNMAYLRRERRANEKADAFVFSIGLSLRGAGE